MLNIFSSQNPLGINISDSSIKLAQIGSKGTLRLLKKIRLPEGCVVNGEIIKEDEAVNTLRELVKEADKIKNISTKEVVCSLPEKTTYLKNLKIQKTGSLKEEIFSEISKFIPEDMEKLYVDWQVLNKPKDNFENFEAEVIVGAGKKDIIEKTTRVIEKAGLLPILMDIESLAAARALIKNEKKQKAFYPLEKNKALDSKDEKNEYTVGILDIGSKESLFSVYNKNLKFSISMPFSDNNILKLISETLKINAKQAKKAKIQCGLDQKKAKGSVRKILSPVVGKLARDIKEIEEYHINYNNGKKFDKILLAGGGASLLALDNAIKQAASIETAIGDATINLKIPPNEDNLLRKETLQYEASIGLALCGYWMAKD